MTRLSRRQVIGGAAATAAAVALGAPSVHAQKGRRILRFAAQSNLSVVDPIWTTAYVTRNHGYLVYDTLFGTDESLQIKPQMVEQFSASANGMTYTFRLRDGLRWHDGQPVRSEDCVESLKRWGKRDRFGQLLMAHTARIAPVDQKTFTLDPAVHFGAGPAAWFGWPEVPQLEKLITSWVRATDQVKRKQVAEEIQKVALDEVTYVPWGEWFMLMACRKTVQGILKFTAPVFWNVTIQ